MIQFFYVFLHPAVNRIIKQLPFQLDILIPFIQLAEVLPHKQEFLAGMSHHKAVSSPKVGKFIFQAHSRHLSCHRAFAVYHLIMGKDEDEIFTVCIQHAEG